MLELLVPHYREPHSVVTRFLDSVAMQEGVDLGDVRVTICNDGTTLDPLPEYPFDVRVTDGPHGGVSRTRNALLDMANGDYVMLCDCDDSFSSTLGLYEVFSHMPFDAMVSPFHQETEGGYLLRRRDPYLIHGKAFRLGYLRDNGIRWMDELTCSGDNYFLWQALLLADDLKVTTMPFYVWRNNEGSVCHAEPDHFQRTYPLTVMGMAGNVADFMRRDRRDLATRIMGMLLLDSYFMTSMPGWDETQPYHDETFGLLHECLAEYGFLLRDMPGDMAEAMYRDRQSCYGWKGPEHGIVGLREHLIRIREARHLPHGVDGCAADRCGYRIQ